MAETISKPSDNLNIVIVGHVDHGKSTLLGRLYADTGSLPDGKIEKIQAICRQQGKEFEYAFLFDAFLEEQEQGITIDDDVVSALPGEERPRRIDGDSLFLFF